MTIRLEALVNGHASKAAQRIHMLPIISPKNPKQYYKMVSKQLITKVQFLFSKSTSMEKTKPQQILILAIKTLHSMLLKKKFCLCHFSLSKLLINTPRLVLKISHFLVEKNSKEKLPLLLSLNFHTWTSWCQDKSMNQLLFGTQMILPRLTRINIPRLKNLERTSRMIADLPNALIKRTWSRTLMKVSELP